MFKRPDCTPSFVGTLLAALLVVGALSARAEAPKVLPSGQSQDWRFAPPKDYDGYFPWTPPKSKEAWAQRSEVVRRQMLVALGLWPMPPKTPLNAVVHGKRELGDYSIEKVYFESHPGFFVTGNLYRPLGAKAEGRRPGVLCPHGHWNNGRFTDKDLNGVRRDIVEGAERFEQGGRSPLQARCVQLARMGCVVFHYDMLGYADSTQLSFELVHRYGQPRPEMETLENWGLFSVQAEAHLQSVLGLQSWNSIRALDFLETLSDVDPQRIGVTGASGGGTQTFILGAIDPRPAVAFPAVMVSTSMQGGCTCENCSLLRVGTGNIEIAALFAPKPQAMTSANDWTKEMETKGFPELKAHYALFGAEKNVLLKIGTQFPHNYNYVSRAAMYAWFNKHLGLGLPEPIVEEDFRYQTKADLTVWDAEHPAPPGGPDFERKLVRYLTETAAGQLAAVTPRDEKSLHEFRALVGGGLEAILGRGMPAAGTVKYEQTLKTDRDTYLEIGGLLRHEPRAGQAEETPILFLYPKQWKGRVVLWLTAQGKSGLYADDGELKAVVRELVDAGASVVGVDLLYQGEHAGSAAFDGKNPRVKNPRLFAGYTYGYNDPIFARRVHDVLTTLAYLKHHELAPKELDLVALDASGPVAACARAIAGDQVDAAAIHTGGFRFGKLTDWQDINFLPGGAKYGDLPGMLALGAPGRLLLGGEGETPAAVIVAAYAAAGKPARLETDAGAEDQRAARAVAWLLKAKE